MAAYTTQTNVELELPNSGDFAADMDAAYFTAQIKAASGLVDAKVGHAFARNFENGTQKFPDHGADPGPPTEIELAARWYAASFAYLKLGPLNRFGPEGEQTNHAQRYQEMADDLLKQIREGELDLALSDGTTLGNEDRVVTSSNDDTVPEVTRGRFDEDGNLVGDEGSLDRF